MNKGYKIIALKDEDYAGEMEYVKKEGIKIISYEDDVYPAALKNIHDFPTVLFCRGEILPPDANAIAIVGARDCTFYGLKMAEKLAFDLAKRGITVVSGMARGIDSAAHRGALRAGGRTIAVMGSGFQHIYPEESGDFMFEIATSGAVLTEYPSQMEPLRGNFPRRNRIISGLARGVIVVEAAQKSGAMITARLALDQGREVFAVPGHADSVFAEGTNALIQSGAKLVVTADDVLEEFGSFVPAGKHGAWSVEHGAMRLAPCGDSEESFTEDDKKVLEALAEKSPAHVDVISDRTGMAPAALKAVLVKLEIKGRVKAVPGGNYKIAKGF